jgi:hypothetical protein
MAITDRSGAVSSDVAIKLPVRAATTANISLSGTPTIDTVALAVDDRVLVKDQTDATENGIYDVAAGAWSRSADCSDSFSFVQGTLVFCLEGSANDDQFWMLNTEDPEIGTSNLTWESVGLSGQTGATGATGATGSTGAAGADAANYGGTSTTSLTIGTGSQAFTTQASMAYQVGARVRLSYTSDTTKYMEGIITAYSDTTMTVNFDVTGSSGTYANWNLNIAGERGATGATGATGDTGATGAAGDDGDDGATGLPGLSYPFTFDTGTTAVDPGSGQIAGNDADLSAATALYINETGSDAVSIAAVLADIDGCTASRKGFVRLISTADSADWVLYYITDITDNGAWQTLAVTYVGGSVTAFSADDPLYVQLDRSTNASSSVGKHTIGASAGAIFPALTNGCADLAQAESSVRKINYKYLAFDPSSVEYAWFWIPTPKSYNASTVTMRAIWTHPSTSTNFGVVWQFEILALDDDDAIDTVLGTAVTVTDTGGTTEDFYRSDESGAITPGNTAAKEDWLAVRVSRLASNGSDTLAVDAHLLGVELYYSTDAADDT